MQQFIAKIQISFRQIGGGGRIGHPPKFFQIGVDFSLWSHYNLIVPTEKKEVKLLGIKKGTRLTDTPKDREFKFRYDADTEMKIQAICEATGKTKAQVIREGIDKLYDEIQSGR